MSMFDFRIINTPDGNQVIDRNLKTPECSLSPLDLLEYTEMENTLYSMDKMREKKRKQEERQHKLARNPLWKLVCFCGIVSQIISEGRFYNE